MNNIVRLEQNNLIENIPPESFAKRVFNKVVNIVVTPTPMKILANMSVATRLYVQVRTSRLSLDEILTDYIKIALYLNLCVNLIEILLISTAEFFAFWCRKYDVAQNENNPIPPARPGRRRITLTDISDILPYDKLQQLPSDYTYAKDDVCPISYEELKQGDSVCCDKKLYSYTALKDSYIKCFKLIPHSLKPLKWNENVYKLPNYGSK